MFLILFSLYFSSRMMKLWHYFASFNLTYSRQVEMDITTYLKTHTENTHLRGRMTIYTAGLQKICCYFYVLKLQIPNLSNWSIAVPIAILSPMVGMLWLIHIWYQLPICVQSFKIGPSPVSFSFIFVLLKQRYNFTTKNVKNDTYSIRCQDSNLQPPDRQFPTIHRNVYALPILLCFNQWHEC